jgi:hypothetical protein
MPLEEKFQLNLTAKHRKSIIEQCFYRFFENFGGNQKDKQPYLRFLAYTIQDFEKNQTPKQFKNWGKNFTDNKFNTESIPFNLQHYIDKAAARIRRKKE